MSDEAVLTSCLTVPSHLVPLTALKDFTVDHKDEINGDRNYRFYDYDENTNSIRFARGNLNLIHHHFGNLKIVDQRAATRMASDVEGHPLAFTGTLRPGQQMVVSAVVEGLGCGQVNAPPRFGKTVTMAAIICQLRLKALLLVHQIDLCVQALNTFYKYTNTFDVEYNLGRKIIGIVEKWEDLDRFDVCFMAYQKFVTGTDGPETLKKVKDLFGVVLVDESHRAPADRYMDVINSFNSKYRLGFSGTTETKTESHKLTNFILGPVVVRATAEKVPCKVIVVKTRIFVPLDSGSKDTRDPLFFGRLLNYLASSSKRIEILVAHLKAYAEAGHLCMGVSERVQLLDVLTKKLKDLNINAESYHGSAFKRKAGREECLQRARNRKISVLNAQRKMTLGLDIPPLTAFFNLLPSANKQNYYQEISRVRTPFPGKNMAYIIDFVDDHQVAYACFQARKKVYQQEGFEIQGGV
jgi:superfamily II DNA or RNA helicase